MKTFRVDIILRNYSTITKYVSAYNHEDAIDKCESLGEIIAVIEDNNHSSGYGNPVGYNEYGNNHSSGYGNPVGCSEYGNY